MKQLKNNNQASARTSKDLTAITTNIIEQINPLIKSNQKQIAKTKPLIRATKG